ncbi:MAG: FtsW/RodA/SpoVE family cell cycle protein, partial [Gammaproteobacteria bacterium]
MSNETRSEQFHPPSLIGSMLRKLHIDIPLLLGLVLIAALSFLILYSASGQDTGTLLRQGARMAVAFVLMTLLAHISPYQFRRHSVLLYSLGIGLLVAVLIMGEIGKGAQRWLDLGFFRFQPSEMIKITTPMMIAWFLAEHPLPPRWGQLTVAALLIAVPTLLIAKQPDLGTALLVASSGAAVLFFAGISWKFIIGCCSLFAALTPVLWHFMHDYQRDRVLTFLNPEADPMGRGYHIIQSKIAIGSGGVYGKGWLGSTQSQLEFLPESSTDFIFAVFAEEFGLSGCLGL